MRILAASQIVRRGWSCAFRARCFSYVCRFAGRWKTVEFRSGIEPDLRQLQVRLANCVRSRLARPFKTFFGHRTILGRRLHGNAPKAIIRKASRQSGKRRLQGRQNLSSAKIRLLLVVPPHLWNRHGKPMFRPPRQRRHPLHRTNSDPTRQLPPITPLTSAR